MSNLAIDTIGLNPIVNLNGNNPDESIGRLQVNLYVTVIKSAATNNLD